MGSLGIKLVGRARPLDYLALMRGILHARGIKLPQDEDASAESIKVGQHLHFNIFSRRHVFSSSPWLLALRAHHCSLQVRPAILTRESHEE